MYGSVRVTQRSISDRSLAALQANLDRVGKTQQQLSSGKQISKPSDDPTGTVSALQLRSEQQRMAQWQRNADDGIGWLGTIDNTLTSTIDQVQRVRDLTLQGMNTGATSQQSREALATEVSAIRDSLIGLANTRYLDRPVFGGTTTGTAAYDAATGGFVGDQSPVARTVGYDAQVRVDVDGKTTFENAAGKNLFAVLTSIAQHLSSDPAQLSTDLGDLDAVTTTLSTRHAEVGARYNRIQQMQAQHDTRQVDLTNSLAEVESIDLPKTIMTLQMQQVGYQAALGATAKVIQPSLVDFLR